MQKEMFNRPEFKTPRAKRGSRGRGESVDRLCEWKGKKMYKILTLAVLNAFMKEKKDGQVLVPGRLA